MIGRRLVPRIVAALIALVALNVRAQTETFLIRSPSSSLSSDGQTIIVEFDVVNNSGSESPATLVRLFDSAGIQLASAPLPPMDADVRQTALLSAPVSHFTPGTYPALYITAGLDALPGGNHIGRGDIASISVAIPAAPENPPAQSTTDTTGSRLPFNLPFDLDLNDPLQIGLAVAIGGLCLILLWVLSIIIRSLTVRPEIFGTWQPAYPPPPVLDPNTTDGRRFLWQQHAQSDALLFPCTPGSIMARKRVSGREGVLFEGWRVSAVRTGRYDQYGRIGKTLHTVPTGVVKRLDKLTRRRKMPQKAAARAVRPVAKGLVRHILKTSDKRNTMLPIAMDVRLKGKGEKPHVSFELFRCESGGWQMMDAWLAAPPPAADNEVVEQFGYSFYGQRHDEPKRAFQKRLEDDIARVLANMVTKPERAPLEDTAGHPPVEEMATSPAIPVTETHQEPVSTDE